MHFHVPLTAFIQRSTTCHQQQHSENVTSVPSQDFGGGLSAVLCTSDEQNVTLRQQTDVAQRIN